MVRASVSLLVGARQIGEHSLGAPEHSQAVISAYDSVHARSSIITRARAYGGSF